MLTQAVILPALNPDGVFAYADRLDWSALLTHPWLLVTHLVDDQRKVITLLLLVAITGLVGLRSPVLLVAVPTILWRFWSGNYGFWGHTWHYSAVLMPMAFVALLDGVELAGRSPRAWLRRYSQVGVAVAVTVAVLVAPQVSFGRFGQPAFWAPNPRADAAHGALAAVPSGASVETDVGLMSYLVDRHDVFWFGNAGNPAADYLVFDSAWGGAPATPDALTRWAAEHHPGATYQVTYDAGGYLVARRSGS
jgi:YD repeat-containing protein